MFKLLSNGILYYCARIALKVLLKCQYCTYYIFLSETSSEKYFCLYLVKGQINTLYSCALLIPCPLRSQWEKNSAESQDVTMAYSTAVKP